MSVDSSASDSVTRVLVDGDRTLGPETLDSAGAGGGGGGLSVVAQQLFREPLDPIRLSRYILLEPLGQGAFGAVYAAYDPELNRKVAIKLLVPRKDHGDDPEKGRDRLLREAQAMAHFTHPNVVAIYDVGTYSLDEKLQVSAVVREGVFLVMELVDGQRFDTWARARKRSWREIVGPAIAAARGLAAAHDAGLVHRDFKPANVLVDRSNQPKVLDFGLARLHGERSESPSSLSSSDVARLGSWHDSIHDSSEGVMLGEALTRTGTVLGTPRYMALEQHRGDDADAASDQYAFCVCLYELLFGGPPFRSRRLDDLIREKLETRELRAPNKDVPQWLFRVVKRGIDPDPQQRYEDMNALIVALQRDPARRRRRVGLVVGLAAVTVGSSVAVGRMSGGAEDCEAHASDLEGVWDPSVAARGEAAFAATTLPHADQSWRTVSTSLDDWAQAWVGQRVELCEAQRRPDGSSVADQGRSLVCLERHLRRTAGLTRVLGTADEEVVAAAGLMASELESPAVCVRRAAIEPMNDALGDPGRAEAEEAVAEARALMAVHKDEAALGSARTAAKLCADQGDDLRARAQLVLARALLHTEHADEARDEVSHAIELAERAGDDELACEGMVVLFRSLAEAGDYDGAELVARLATSRIEAALVGDRVAAMLAYHRGALRLTQGRYDEGYDPLMQARILRERMHGPSHPLVAQVDNALGVALYRDGRREEALEAFERAIAGFEGALGPEHPQLGRVYNNLGNYWMAAGSYDRAYEQLQRSAQINAANYPPDHPSHGTAHHNLALVARAQGDRHKALRHLEQSEKVRSTRLGDEHPNVLRVRSLRAGVLSDIGREYEAIALMREVLRSQISVLGPTHHETFDTTFSLAESLVERGESAEGVTLAEEGIAAARKDKAGSDELGRWLVVMARIYRQVDRKEDADAAVAGALELLRFDSGESSPILSQAHLVRGGLALDRGDASAAEASFTIALEIIEGMFGAEHGRVAWPLRQRASARLAAEDRVGARTDLERALRVADDYNGPPLQPPSIRFELAQVLPPSESERAADLVAQARENLRQIRAEGSANVVSEAEELEQAMVRWRAAQ